MVINGNTEMALCCILAYHILVEILFYLNWFGKTFKRGHRRLSGNGSAAVHCHIPHLHQDIIRTAYTVVANVLAVTLKHYRNLIVSAPAKATSLFRHK